MKVSFIVPAYNEAKTLDEVLSRVHELELDKQVVVIDDGSTDATPEILQRWQDGNGVVVVSQPNRGRERRSEPHCRTSTVKSPSSKTRTWSTTPLTSQH